MNKYLVENGNIIEYDKEGNIVRCIKNDMGKKQEKKITYWYVLGRGLIKYEDGIEVESIFVPEYDEYAEE